MSTTTPAQPAAESGVHTPGPWQAVATRQRDKKIGTEWNAWHIACSTHVVATTPGSCDADARLIAAAPDLLAFVGFAGRQFRFYEQQHRAKGTPDADAKADVNRVLAEQAETLIAAATARTTTAGQAARGEG